MTKLILAAALVFCIGGPAFAQYKPYSSDYKEAQQQRDAELRAWTERREEAAREERLKKIESDLQDLRGPEKDSDWLGR